MGPIYEDSSVAKSTESVDLFRSEHTYFRNHFPSRRRAYFRLNVQLSQLAPKPYIFSLTTPVRLLSSPSASVHPVPAGRFRYRGQPLLKLGSLFSPRQSRSLGRLLATYLLTYRAPGQREKATYLLFGTTGTELYVALE